MARKVVLERDETWPGGVLAVERFDGLFPQRGLVVKGVGAVVYHTEDCTPKGLRVARLERFRDWAGLRAAGWRPPRGTP